MRVYQRRGEERSAWREGASTFVRSSPEAPPTREAHSSVLAAKWALDRLVHAWRAEGFTRVETQAREAEEPELDVDAFMAALRQDPDELANYLVFGDWLSTRGDPHGQLIALHCALAQLPRFGSSKQRDKLARDELRLMFEHAGRLWGPLGETVVDADTQSYAFDLIRAQWHCGFIRSAKIPDVGARFELGQLIEGFGGLAITAMVDELEFEQQRYPPEALRALGRGSWPMLRTLRLTRNFSYRRAYEYDMEVPDTLPEFDAALLFEELDPARAPRLEVLTIDQCTANVKLAEALVRSPMTGQLRELEIVGMDLDIGFVERLRRAPFAALERLKLEGPDLPRDTAERLEGLATRVKSVPWTRLE